MILIKSESVCPNCGKTYNNLKPSDKPFNCSKCGGVVVSPSGKTLTRIVPIEPVFHIDDGESFWIMAADEEEALAFYKKEMDISDDDEVSQIEISELSLEELSNLKIHEEDSGEAITALEFLLKNDLDKPPVFIAGTVW
jgi:hypothetical protein